MQRLSTFLLLLVSICSGASAQSLTDPNGDVLPHRQEVLPDYNGLRLNDFSIPAGDAIEGDYIGQMAFTSDGQHVLVPHRTTANVSVIDWESRSVILDIPVGQQPVEIIADDRYAVVPCFSGNEAYVIDLADFSVAAVFPTAAQPTKARISRDGSTAAVACDEGDVLEVFNLDSLTHTTTINGFRNYLYRFSANTSNTRNFVYWSGFELSPDGSTAVVGGEEAVQFFDTQTGALLAELDEVPAAGQLGLSGDGEYVIALEAGSNGKLSRIHIPSQTTESQLSLGATSGPYSSVAVNMDGTRAIVPMQSGGVFLARFDLGDVQTIPVTTSPNWVMSSADYNYAVGGQFYLNIFDFDSGQVTGSSQGIPIQNGAVSPANNRMVATDPLRFEGLDYYEFEDPTDLNYQGRSPTGSIFEADASYSVTLAEDRSKALVANTLSGSISIVDLEDESLEAIIPLGSPETYYSAIGADGRYAYVPKRQENEVAVIDLQTYELVKTISSGGSRPDQIFNLPDGERAYVLNAGGQDAIGVLRQAGPNTVLEDNFTSGNTGISWTNFGLRCELAITREGDYGVLPTPFDNEVQIIDLNTDQIVASVSVDGFPLQVAISDEIPGIGRMAGVTLRNGGGIALIAPIGPGASLLGTYEFGGTPTRIAYDALQQAFLVCDQDNAAVQVLDILNEEYLAPMFFPGGRTPISLIVDELGVQHTLLRSSDTNQSHLLQSGDEFYALPSLPIHNMAAAPNGQIIAIPLIAEDALFVVDRSVTGGHTVAIPLRQASTYDVFPLPARSEVAFRKRGEAAAGTAVTLQLMNSEGRLVRSLNRLPAGTFSVQREELPAGLYYYRIQQDGQLLGSGQLIFE